VYRSFPKTRGFSGLLLFVALVGGCGKNDIKVYSVPKEPSSPLTQADQSSSPPGTAAPVPQLRWKTPVGWKEVQPGEMRVASFKVMGTDGKQADVSVIPLPGDAGGDFSNVNRWRGQVSLSPVSEDELKKLTQSVELAGQPADLYEQDGKNPAGEPTRILAVIQRRDEMAWFFKMTGDSQLVADEKSNFVEFLKSIQFTAGEPVNSSPPSSSPFAGGSLPAGHPDISAAPSGALSAPVSSAGRPKWNVPGGWKEVPGGQFLAAKFLINGDGGGQAAVNVSSSAGTGGGVAANVNRWRKQLGLGELSGDELAKVVRSITTTSGQATLVEMNGTDARSGQPASLVGAIVLQPGQAWFYKLMGDAPTVGAQKEAFTAFVQQVEY
jgi:hypothetical protein